MMTSYDTNEQVHLTFDRWEKHGGRCVHVGIPESLFLIFFGTYMSCVQINRTIFHLIWWGLYCCPTAKHCLDAQVHRKIPYS